MLNKTQDPEIPKVGFPMFPLLALKFGIFRPQIWIPHQKLYL